MGVEYSVEEPEDREDFSRVDRSGFRTHGQASRFLWRGSLEDAAGVLDRWVWRSRVARAWSDALGREGLGLSKGILTVSAFVSLFALGWAGAWGVWVLFLSLLAHAGLGGVLWWLQRARWEMDGVRVEHVRRWLSEARAVMPEGTRVDVDIDLRDAPHTLSCCETGTCGAPWFLVGLESPAGVTVRTRVTHGGSCPALRNRAEEGSSWVQMDLGGDAATWDVEDVEELVVELAHEPVPHGFRTKRARSSSLYRARWELEQDHTHAGQHLPSWPLKRLMLGHDPHHIATACSPRTTAQRETARWASHSARLWPIAERWGWASGLHRERWVRLVGSPALVLMTGLMVVHGGLGAALLGIQATQAGLQTSGGLGGSLVVGSVSSWGAVFLAVMCMGVMGLWSVARRWADEVERVRRDGEWTLGTLSVSSDAVHMEEISMGTLDEDGDFVGGGETLSHHMDLMRPFRAHITREKGQLFGGRVRVFLSLFQEQGESLSAFGVSFEVDAKHARIVEGFDVKHALYPEIQTHDAVRCLERICFALEAHGEPVYELHTLLSALSQEDRDRETGVRAPQTKRVFPAQEEIFEEVEEQSSNPSHEVRAPAHETHEAPARVAAQVSVSS